MDEQLDFVTMGMFIIDEIHFKPPKPPELDVLGGAGSWSILGARLFRPSSSSKKVSWIVHRGSDFPQSLSDQIESWQTDCSFLDTPERMTTRGWNSYGADEARAFRYLTPKLRIDETQLTDKQVLAKCFHLICTPNRCIDLVEGLKKRRQGLLEDSPGLQRSVADPVFVWEPVPDACKAGELENALQALKYVDVVSPNHQELAAFFGEPGRTSDPHADEERMIAQCQTLLDNGFCASPGAVVVRRGELGCYSVTTNGISLFLPAYHMAADAAKVVDPTGAGNAFLGGFCVGYLDSKTPTISHRVKHGVLLGTVAASFAIEQVGLPKLSCSNGEEHWNGDNPIRRLAVIEESLVK